MKPSSDAASCAETRGSDTRHSVGDSLTRDAESWVFWAVLCAITLFLSLVAPLATLRIEALTSLGQSFDSWQG